MKQRIFVSHPYAMDPEENKKKVEEICKEIWNDGMIPISPVHMFSYMTDDRDRKEIMAICMSIIRHCDQVWVYGDSSGCREEKQFAQSCHIPVKIKYKENGGEHNE